jgi:hypothetical protein
MRNMKWLILAALAIPAAGCVESADQSYGYSNGYYAPGYSGGYYPSSGYSSGYYATPRVNNYYYPPSPTVVTQTRYVPVPTPVPVPVRQADRSNDHRWNRDNNQHQSPPQHVDRPHSSPPQASNPQPNNDTGNNSRHNGNWHDRDGDGKPDRRS